MGGDGGEREAKALGDHRKGQPARAERRWPSALRKRVTRPWVSQSRMTGTASPVRAAWSRKARVEFRILCVV